MRRIKSAPANLASMSHNKICPVKSTISILDKKNYLLCNYDENFKKNNIIPLNNYKEKRDLKNKLTDIGDYLSDITTNIDNIPVEETTFISAVILYVSQNILKREKLKEFNNFLFKIIFKYIIIYWFHVYILKDDTNYLFHISDIFDNIYISNFKDLPKVVPIINEKYLIDNPCIINLSKLYNNNI
jgi:hypothetical protein